MNLNRRTLFTRLAGLIAGGAALGIASNKVEASVKWKSRLWSTTNMPHSVEVVGLNSPPTTYPTPPPADHRTPEQVYMDDVKQREQYIEATVNGTNSYEWYHHVQRVPSSFMADLKSRLTAKGITPDIRIFNGEEFLVLHGNLYTVEGL